MKVVYYSTPAGNCQPVDFIDDLQPADAAAILSDIDALARYGRRAPVQMRPIKGHGPMMELKTHGFRTFFVQKRDVFWILHVCKKQDQRRAIEAAATRMEKLPEDE